MNIPAKIGSNINLGRKMEIVFKIEDNDIFSHNMKIINYLIQLRFVINVIKIAEMIVVALKKRTV